jgi:hypothetical protein
MAKDWRVEADRFNPGEWVVKDRLGNVLAHSFESEADAQAWIDAHRRIGQ